MLKSHQGNLSKNWMFLFLSSILEKGPPQSSPSTKSRIPGHECMSKELKNPSQPESGHNNYTPKSPAPYSDDEELEPEAPGCDDESDFEIDASQCWKRQTVALVS